MTEVSTDSETAMAVGLRHHFADISGSRVHFVIAGQGKPLVLLHGWPQTWYAWRKVIPAFAERYQVIVPDLRGLGESSRPVDGFDKKTVANDVAVLLRDILKISSAHVIGHDWGGPVAFALAAFSPGLVENIVMLDAAVPGDGSGTFSQAGKRWHHAFHQTRDLPENLISGREDAYYRWFYENYGHGRDAMSEPDIQEYLRTYRSAETLRCGLAYYRAIEQDVMDNETYLRGNRLSMPILAFGGNESFGRGSETLASLSRVGVNVSGGVVESCGHWIPEERPNFVLTKALPFLAESSRSPATG